MARLLLLLIIAAAVFFLVRWISRQPGRVRWQLAAISLAVILFLLFITGRAHWLAALFAAILPFIRGFLSLLGNLAMLRRIFGGLGTARAGQGASGNQTSTVQSRYIRMTLDHDSGEIGGEILEGQFAGNTLSQLDLNALMELLKEIQDDDESVALLQAYLDRVYEDDWRDQAGHQAGQQQPSASGAMTREEALDILGLAADASDDEVVQAHRRLIQKLHPDRGGSEYLASKINMAKDILLDR